MTTDAAQPVLPSHVHATTALDAALSAEAARASAAEAALAVRIAKLEAGSAPTPPPPSAMAFLGWPKSAPKTVNGGTDVEVNSLSFSGYWSGPALVISGASGGHLHDLDFDSCEGGIYLVNCTGTWIIETIRARNIGDYSSSSGSIGSGHSNVIQLNGSYLTSGLIQTVHALGGRTEDMISVFNSGGTDASHPLTIQHCALQGLYADTATAKAWQSGSGSGSMLGDGGGHDIVYQFNTLLDPGQVGIGIPGGSRVHVLDNILYGHQRTSPGSNVGIYTPYSPAAYVGANEVARNRVFWLNAAGGANPFWDGGASGTVAGLNPQTNTWQDATIDPTTLAVVL